MNSIMKGHTSGRSLIIKNGLYSRGNKNLSRAIKVLSRRII
jgi:hypothetical protein